MQRNNPESEVASIREEIRELIASITPYDATEQHHIDHALAWIQSGAPLFRIEKPATPPRHLVAYFALLDPAQRKVLLVDHRKAELWLPSGGHVEPDEHPRDTVVRELREELDIDADFLLPQPIFITVTETVGSTAGHIDISLWYLLRGNSTQPLAYDAGEFHGIAWFPLDDLPLERTDPHMERFAGKALSILNF